MYGFDSDLHGSWTTQSAARQIRVLFFRRATLLSGTDGPTVAGLECTGCTANDALTGPHVRFATTRGVYVLMSAILRHVTTPGAHVTTNA